MIKNRYMFAAEIGRGETGLSREILREYLGCGTGKLPLFCRGGISLSTRVIQPLGIHSASLKVK